VHEAAPHLHTLEHTAVACAVEVGPVRGAGVVVGADRGPHVHCVDAGHELRHVVVLCQVTFIAQPKVQEALFTQTQRRQGGGQWIHYIMMPLRSLHRSGARTSTHPEFAVSGSKNGCPTWVRPNVPGCLGVAQTGLEQPRAHHWRQHTGVPSSHVPVLACRAHRAN
jgi:hypothetical protein